LSDQSETDSRLHLEKIKNIIPKLNEMGKRKGAAEKGCIITLYAASSVSNLKYKGHINKKDGCRYFSISTLRDIAKNEEQILGRGVDISFDKDTATKVYKKFEQQGYVKFLPKPEISKAICLGDTSPVMITEEGKEESKTVIVELLDPPLGETFQSYDRALQINPNYATAWLDKGIALDQLGRYIEAVQCYNTALQIDPNLAFAWNNKGKSLVHLQHYNEAIQCTDTALKIDPNLAMAWDNKAWALGNLEKYEEAIECIDRALQIDPNFVIASHALE
jgi:tetratricopeptide (TPR) repeat protein